MTFVTKEINENQVVGDLTIKGETHEETFDVEFNGVSKINEWTTSHWFYR